MIKMLLVDDEANILRNLQTVLPWNEMGIDWVGAARNGREALELALGESPDIVVTDIRMPIMDGIQFLQALRESGSRAELILLTGFPDFEYARSAIQLRVREYVVKPIDYDELRQVIERTALSIRTERLQRDRDRRQWGQVKRMAYEKLLQDVLTDMSHVVSGELPTDGEDPVEGRGYTIIVADLDDYSHKSLHWSERERKLWNFAVKNILQEALQPLGLTYTVPQIREGEWCILIERCAERPTTSEEVKEWTALLQSAVSEHIKLGLSLCYNPGNVMFADLPVAYRDARRHLLLNTQEQQVLNLGSEVLTGNPDRLEDSLWGVVEKIVSAVKGGEFTQVVVGLQQFQEGLQRLMKRSEPHAEQVIHFAVLHMLREFRDVGFVTQAEEEKIWRKLGVSRGDKDVLSILNQLASDAVRTSGAKSNAELWVIQAKDYIERRLSDDFGIEEVASYLNISASYFSLKFKQAVGETFLEYVTRLRMERARTLLARGDRSVAQVGKMVGYEERRYFTKVFHKVFGISPTEYKEAVMRGRERQ